MSKALIFFIVGALPLAAQSNTGGTAGSTTTTSTSPATPARIPTPTTTPNTTQTTPTVQAPPRPIFISGKVMMEDGLPVPSNVVIQRVCSSAAHAVAYTDSKGRFNFQWNQTTSSMFMDASESSSGRDGFGNSGFGASSAGGSGVRSGGLDSSTGPSLSGCELQANLAGYRSDVVHLFNHSASDNPDVGMIVLHRIAGVEGNSVSATTLGAPKDAKKAYDRAQQSLLKSKPDDAAKDFEKATDVYPKFADAWVSLGKIRVQQKSFDAAHDAFVKAIEADPKLVFPYIELGLMSADKGQWAETAEYLDKGTKLDPVDYPKAWFVNAVANYNLKRFDAAEKCAREAMKLDPKHANPRADYLLGLVLAEKHDYTGAATQLKSYLKLMPNAPDLAVVTKQLSQLEGFVAEAQPPAEPDTKE